ncbi:MAG: hypothetical protein J6D29_09030 [Solobacterium sp.]|nr:hypothetical protein [Solobacterium sp.]
MMNKLKRYAIYAGILFIIGVSVFLFWPILLILLGVILFYGYRMRKQGMVIQKVFQQPEKKIEPTGVIIDAEFTEKDREEVR